MSIHSYTKSQWTSEMERGIAHTVSAISFLFSFSFFYLTQFEMSYTIAAQQTEVNLSWRQFNHISAFLFKIDMCQRSKYTYCIERWWDKTHTFVRFMTNLTREKSNGKTFHFLNKKHFQALNCYFLFSNTTEFSI